jgi:low temperature requirement protein LtrA
MLGCTAPGYGHFPLGAGIIVAALGVEGVLAHADESQALGGFYATALFGGYALYLAGHLLFKRRMHRTVSVPRLTAVAVLLAALPGAALAPPLAALVGLLLILVGLIVAETTRYAQVRRDVRNT